MTLNTLIIDQGGHSSRVRIIDKTGAVLCSAKININAYSTQPPYIEYDAQKIVQSIDGCLQEIGSQVSEKNIKLLTVVLITQRSSFVACTKDDLKPITPIISWQDTRHQDWLQKRIDEKYFNLEQLKKLTGLRLNAHYGASKMRWLLDNNKDLQKEAQQKNLIFLPLASYLTSILTHSKNPILDEISASRTFLVEQPELVYKNASKLQWSNTLLKHFGIEDHMLPKLVGSNYCFGNLSLAKQSIPLSLVGGDQSFISFAYGSEALKNSLFVNAGTGAFVQAHVPIKKAPFNLLSNLIPSNNGQQDYLHIAEGTVNACASALDWLWQKEDRSLTYVQIQEALTQIKDPPIFYHRITALGSPYWLPAGESYFSPAENLSLAEKTVAVLESVIFLLTININLLKQAEPKLKQILISGGVSQLDGFCQRLANCVKIPVVRHTDHEASIRGAAFYAIKTSRYQTAEAPEYFAVNTDSSLLGRYQQFKQHLKQSV